MPHSFTRGPLLATLRWLWLLLVLLCGFSIAMAFIGGRQFDTSILALLPDDEQDSVSHLAKQRLAAIGESRLLFLVAHTDRQESLQAAQRFAAELSRADVFSAVQGEMSGEQQSLWLDSLWPYRYNFLSDSSREQLQQYPIDNKHPALQTAIARLYSPLAATVAPDLLGDPLQLFYEWRLRRLPAGGFSLEDNWLTRQVDGRVYRLVSAELTESPYGMAYQRAVMDTIAQAKRGLGADTQVLQSGLLFHAAYGASQAQREISTIGLGSIAGISLLLIYALRRTRPVVLAFLPLVAGLVFSFAICLWLFDRLHLITLAFGAGLVGVAIDYSLHYLCADFETKPDRDHGSSLATLTKIFPAISLGLLSSVLAYAAQAAAPFPGLRQMASFSALGLIGAWLTVVLWFPVLRNRAAKSANQELGLVPVLQKLLERWPTTKAWPIKVLFTICTLLGIWTLLQVDFDDDIRRLQTSPDSLLAEDTEVQRLLGGINPGQYFVVSAADTESLLLKLQGLQNDLNNLISSGNIKQYQSLALWVPPLQQQNADRQLQSRTVFNNDGLLPLLASQLGYPKLVADANQLFDANNQPITLENWLAMPMAEAQSHLWLGEFEGQVHGMVTLSGINGVETLKQLEALSNLDAGIRFIDNVSTISNLLKFHRQQFQRWLLVAYAIVLALLIWRYGLAAWRLLAAPAIASSLALGLLALSGAGLNIFNLLALLLVLGIGLDASIFLKESHRSAYAWVAVTLAAATTLMAFGLLGLSATPVLHQFGITVLLGITGVWLIAPCFVIDEKFNRAKHE